MRMQENADVIVAHPYKQHSYKLAMALNQEKRLLAYCTTVYDKKNSITSNIKYLLPEKYKKLIEKKKCDSFFSHQVKVFCEGWGLLFIFVTRIPIVNKLYRYLGAFVTKKFGVCVAKYAIKMKAKAVVMYDTTADSCFDYLKKKAPNIIRILDVSSNASAERLRLYESIDDIEVKKELKREFKYLWNKNFQKRNQREIYNTDYFLVPSTFSKDSIISQGVSKDKIYVVPYGVDNKSFEFVIKENKLTSQIKMVYTGNISYEKGVNYLLEAISELPKEQFKISLMGTIPSKSVIYQKYKGCDNIEFKGYVSHKELAKIYANAHVFAIASLGEGFTLSALEAMSCGLPVLCSENSGVNDVIVQSTNGLIFPICSVEAIKESLIWLYNNKQLLPELAQNAHDTAVQYNWEAYYKKMQCVFTKIMEKE